VELATSIHMVMPVMGGHSTSVCEERVAISHGMCMTWQNVTSVAKVRVALSTTRRKVVMQARMLWLSDVTMTHDLVIAREHNI
jgi:hypothetical protein